MVVTARLCIALVVLALGGVACGESVAPPRHAPARGGSALAALDTLAVKGRAPKTGYDRDRFGAGAEIAASDAP